MLTADDWWQDVLARHAGDDIAFAAPSSLEAIIPANLFDTVLENCLENARKKKATEPATQITVEFSADAGIPVLSITDTGSAIPSGAMEGLFRAPVANSRRGGYGIGLYQAFQQAEQAGYNLTLNGNQAGRVRFELRKIT